MDKIIKFLVVLFLNGQWTDAFQNTVNDISGKYVQFNSFNTEHLNPDLPVWFYALKESVLISLGNDAKLR